MRLYAVVVSVCKGVQNGSPLFKITRFDVPPILVYVLSKIYHLLFMIVSFINDFI